MKNVGIAVIFVALLVRIFQTSAWFRYDENKYKVHFEKSISIFGLLKFPENIDEFRKLEKRNFYLSIFLLVLFLSFKLFY